MYQTITRSMFHDAFNSLSETYKNSFSYEGLNALFQYFEDHEESGDGAIELDPIAICCEFTEYPSAVDAAQNHGCEEVVDLEPHGNVDLLEVTALEENQALEWLSERTPVIRCENGNVIVKDF